VTADGRRRQGRGNWRAIAGGGLAGALVAACLLPGRPALRAAGQAPAAPTGSGPRVPVALTFDDLPSHGPLPEGVTRAQVAARIIEALRTHKAPAVYGFVNAGKLTDRPEDHEVLRLWRAAGFPLANHAFSHMDLHANAAEAFEQDVVANETSLQSLMGAENWRWFRYPYLREGDSPAKHRRVREFLEQRGYRVAQVTMDFSDWAYNGPYARCLARKDAKGLEWLEASYMKGADRSLTRAQEQARTLFQRDIKHVMLLHIGAFETVMLPRLLKLLDERGFTLTTLEDAQGDEAYAARADGLAGWNGTWLQQLLRARGTPPPPDPDSPFDALSKICQ
jgi:peptidoglycan/xylan/chitin deacetylase (PgdA/CDA1 family)